MVCDFLFGFLKFTHTHARTHTYIHKHTYMCTRTHTNQMANVVYAGTVDGDLLVLNIRDKRWEIRTRIQTHAHTHIPTAHRAVEGGYCRTRFSLSVEPGSRLEVPMLRHFFFPCFAIGSSMTCESLPGR